MNKLIRVVVADDHTVVRQGLCALLSAQSDLTVVGQTGEGLEVVDLVAKHKPDVLVLDLMLPNVSGFDIARQVAKLHPRCRVLILSMHATKAYVAEALRCGAAGYALKASDATEILRAIQEIAAGRRYLPPSMSEADLEPYETRDSGEFDPYDTLTGRERQVLKMVAEGLTNAAVADKLSISPRTVEIHRANAMRKLDLQNHAALVRYAVKRGLISVEND